MVKHKSNLDTFGKENILYFDRWANSYDHGRISSWFQYTQMLTIGFLDLKKSSRVLDVGCGTGHAVIELANRLPKGKAFGIDISPKMIEQALSKIPVELQAKVEFRQANSDNIPYPNRYFDNIMCTNSFHHYPDPIKSLTEMQRVLRPGGQLLIFENALELSWYTRLWDLVLRFKEKGHVRYYRSDELGEIILKARFDDLRLCFLKNVFLKHGKLHASIQIWSGRAPSNQRK